MTRFWTVGTKLVVLVGLILMSQAFAQVMTPSEHISRGPASYVPDDDAIVKPVPNELSFYQQYIGNDNSNEVLQSRNQIQIWQKNKEFAEQYGMNNTLAGSPYFSPTPEQSWEYFNDRYLRYLRRRGESPVKDAPKNWYQEYRASNEVDTIDEIEGRFKKSNKSANGTTESQKSLLPPSLREKEFKIWKNTRFIFQPRVDQGIILLGFRGPLGYARAWVGANGQTEIKFEKIFDKSGTRFLYNYYAHSGEYFTSVDQRIIENVSARYTTSQNPETGIKDNTLMLLYAKPF